MPTAQYENEILLRETEVVRLQNKNKMYKNS